MTKINCNVIKDLLPLYVDNLVSEDTKVLVESHLNKCKACNEEYRKMANVLQMPVECDVQPIKEFQKKWNRKKIVLVGLTTIISSVLFLGVGIWLQFYGFLVSEEDIEVTTEIQECLHGYLKEEYVFHFKKKEQTPLYVYFKDIYEENSDGEKVLVGYEVEVREPIINIIPDPNGYTFGYTYHGLKAPDEDFDFTVEIKCKDGETVYSMREEGLFSR